MLDYYTSAIRHVWKKSLIWGLVCVRVGGVRRNIFYAWATWDYSLQETDIEKDSNTFWIFRMTYLWSIYGFAEISSNSILYRWEAFGRCY